MNTSTSSHDRKKLLIKSLALFVLTAVIAGVISDMTDHVGHRIRGDSPSKKRRFAAYWITLIMRSIATSISEKLVPVNVHIANPEPIRYFPQEQHHFDEASFITRKY